MKHLHLFTLIAIFLTSSITSSFAQDLDHVLGDILIQTRNGVKIEHLQAQLQQFNQHSSPIKEIRAVSKPLDIWCLQFDPNTTNERHLMAFVKRHPDILIAQYNHLVEMRETIPNDDFFDNQWQHLNTGAAGGTADADIDAELAWDITTGGLSARGDTIVVAVLDSGVETNHDDLKNNLWVNHNEIPGNGIDDDNNGYIDDYRGWNILSDDDNVVPSGSHGTSVSGIIGAEGNNEMGVAGVNWQVKIMMIKNNFSTAEANVLEAYTYALDARIKYNETNGAEGAFVVATNASWGSDFGNPEDAPLWCNFYDVLGAAGIISCGGTINADVNVDEVGDLPTTCPSDYLIAVTNTNRTDNKFNNAGYGATSIDLGAPGDNIFTTTFNNNYSEFNGTSAATPVVTGAVALLYAAPCNNIIDLARVSPEVAASQVRQHILDGVDLKSSLQNITSTGGRLNVFNSLELLMDACVSCPSPYSLANIETTDTATKLTWSDGLYANATNLRWRQLGSTDWNEVTGVSAPFNLINLLACTDYEFQTLAVCAGENSTYSPSFIFRTDGCCEAPNQINVLDITDNAANISWNAVLAAASYNLKIINPNGASTLVENISNNNYQLIDLDLCAPYEIAIQTVCQNNETTGFSSLTSFITGGCGTCTDSSYCASKGGSANEEWISQVRFSDLNNSSPTNGGYGNFAGLVLPANVETSNTYNIVLTPGFSGISLNEYFRVWIDYIDFGEVEDYCVFIEEGMARNCNRPAQLDTMEVLEETAMVTWVDESDDHSNHNLRFKKVIDTDWTFIANVNSPYTLQGLEGCFEYEFQVEANCADDATTSGFAGSCLFETFCIIDTETPLVQEEIKIYPNPFNQGFSVELELSQAGTSTLFLLDAKGQLVYQKAFEGPASFQTLNVTDIAHLPAGIYFLKISSPDGLVFQKVMKY